MARLARVPTQVELARAAVGRTAARQLAPHAGSGDSPRLSVTGPHAGLNRRRSFLSAQGEGETEVTTATPVLKLYSERGFQGVSSRLAMSPRLGCLPVIPHRKCPLLPRASKILLSNTTPTLNVEKSRTPVGGLRSKSRPLDTSRTRHPNLFLRPFSVDIPFRLLLSFLFCSPASFSLRTDRSLGSDARLPTHREPNHFNHFSH
jgi:hypothetical protein